MANSPTAENVLRELPILKSQTRKESLKEKIVSLKTFGTRIRFLDELQRLEGGRIVWTGGNI